MRGFNGKSLTDEWATEQSDSSSAHLSRVLTYICDGILDISARHDWERHRRKGKKILTASAEEQELKTSVPTAATTAFGTSGGSLTDTSVYVLYVTYEDSNGYQTPAGTASASATAATPNLQLDVTAIPVSAEPLVTKRHLYVSKDGGNILFSQTISDNTTTTATVSTNPTDSDATARPPEFDQIRKVHGAPFDETNNRLLVYRDISQMRELNTSGFTDGSTETYGFLTDTKLLLDPRPSSAVTLSFNYYKRPLEVTYSLTSIPDLIPELKPLLRFYVMMRGYEFRDRDGSVSKYRQYEDMVLEYISRFGQRKHAREQVRDVSGDSDGYETTSL